MKVGCDDNLYGKYIGRIDGHPVIDWIAIYCDKRSQHDGEICQIKSRFVGLIKYINYDRIIWHIITIKGDNMSNISKIFNDVEACAAKKNRTNKIICYKKALVNEIEGNREEYLRIKQECIDETDDSIFNITIYTVTLIFAVLSIVMNLVKSNQIDQGPDIGSIIFAVLFMLYIILIAYFGIRQILHKRRYKYIKLVIEDMESNWDKYFI